MIHHSKKRVRTASESHGHELTELQQTLNTVRADLIPVSAQPWTRLYQASDKQFVLTVLPETDWISALSNVLSVCFTTVNGVAPRNLHLATTSIS